MVIVNSIDNPTKEDFSVQGYFFSIQLKLFFTAPTLNLEDPKKEESVAKHTFPSVKIAGAKRILNARKDTPDIRDRMYEPALIQLQPKIDNRGGTDILDQGREGACTGFGLAAVINLLNIKKRDLQLKVSPRMLYEMAKKHDEWPGEDYAGSSCRGAIQGWKNMGVCSEADWRYSEDDPGELTIARAKAARSCTVGAYYRLRPEINDYHVAMNEVGAIYVSADVHSGWFNPKAAGKNKLAVITPSSTAEGGHAFAIVGYNSQGFIVQNSWGPKWGTKVIKAFVEALQGSHLQIHLAGHSTGAVLLGHLLNALDVLDLPDLIESCSLMAPACSIDFYQEHYVPRLKGQEKSKTKVKLPTLSIFNLSEQLELDDNVALVYRKSLLYLVSRALERKIDKPLLGMQKYSKKLTKHPGLSMQYSDGKKGVTRSTSHGGFDNDVYTLNTIMTGILKKVPSKPFTMDEMRGY